DNTGSVAVPNGIGVSVSTSNNLIARSVISGNNGDGVRVTSGSGNQVKSCDVGINGERTAAVANLGNGIVVGGTNKLIGSLVAEEMNSISGNRRAGVVVTGNNNTVAGNLIGTDGSGTFAVGNADGVVVNGSNNVIGGNGFNLISGNRKNGIYITGNGNALT